MNLQVSLSSDRPGEAAKRRRWEALVSAVCKAVSEAASADKGLCRHRSQLASDILVLVLGLRPSFLLDYVRTRQGTLQSLLSQLELAIHTFQPGKTTSHLRYQQMVWLQQGLLLVVVGFVKTTSNNQLFVCIICRTACATPC